jgi:hypothetical protein
LREEKLGIAVRGRGMKRHLTLCRIKISLQLAYYVSLLADNCRLVLTTSSLFWWQGTSIGLL